MAELRDLIADTFDEFLHQEGARQRPHDFADDLLIALGRGGYVLVPHDDDQHVIEFRADGWTIQHPLACRPNLFDCPVNRAAERDLVEPPGLGRFECSTNDLGDRLLIGDSIGGYDTSTLEDRRVQTDPPRPEGPHCVRCDDTGVVRYDGYGRRLPEDEPCPDCCGATSA